MKGVGEVVYEKVCGFDLSWGRKCRITAFLDGPFRLGLWWVCVLNNKAGFEMSEAEELWELHVLQERGYLGQEGVGELRPSGLEGICYLKGTGKLYIGLIGLRQKHILERTETRKLEIPSWQHSEKTMEKEQAGRYENSRKGYFWNGKD